MASVNINILGNSELKWTEMVNLIQMTIISNTGQESLRRNRLVHIVNKRVQNAGDGCNPKNDRIISVHFQGRSYSITVIQVYDATTSAKETEIEWF